MILSTYAGEAIHSRKNGSVFRFRPHGELHNHSGSVAAKHEAADVEKLGEGTLSARLFVGLSAPSPSGKQVPTYSVEDVVKAVVEIRKAQGQIPDSTFMAQKGVYTESKTGQLIEEDSVQIIIIDISGASERDFTSAVQKMAEELRARFHQDSIIVEIQRRGLMIAVYSVYQ